jgi:hypothetical protein
MSTAEFKIMKPRIYYWNGQWRCLSSYRKFHLFHTVAYGAGDTPFDAWIDWAWKVPLRVIER